MSAARDMLLQMLGRDSDMQLVSKSADGATEVLPGHSLIGLWSSVMRAAIEAESSRTYASAGSDPARSTIRVPMTLGTSTDDWLLAMEFLYQVPPPPAADWDNLETLLSVADKYCMPAIAQRVGAFLLANTEKLDLEPESKQFSWKWIFVADKYGLVDVAKQCISKATYLHMLVKAWPKSQPHGYNGHHLSSEVLDHLMMTLTTGAVVLQQDMPYCPRCEELDGDIWPEADGPRCGLCGGNVIVYS